MSLRSGKTNVQNQMPNTSTRIILKKPKTDSSIRKVWLSKTIAYIMREMSFADESFTKAYTINTVYFWSDLNKAMLEIRRVLKSDGVFINTLYTNGTLSSFSHTRFGYKRYNAN